MTSERARKMTSFTTDFRPATALVLCLTLNAQLVTGSDSRRTAPAGQDSLESKPIELRPLYAKSITGGARDRVLHCMNIGVAAFEMKRYDLARDAFDEAIAAIETVYAGHAGAAEARTLWAEEGRKVFKGEPYERAMVYLYRGLMYLHDGDFENARATFKAGLLQDGFAEEEQYRIDFASLIFLQGWASQCLGDAETANMAYQEVKRLRPTFVPPDPTHNALVIVETGTAPRKVGDGVGHYELKFRRGKGIKEESAVIAVGETVTPALAIEDVFWQASTRGGRQFDKILEGKAVFRQRNELAGTTNLKLSEDQVMQSMNYQSQATNYQIQANYTTAAGGDATSLQLQANTATMQADLAAGAGVVLGLMSVVQLARAAKTKPQADTRCWQVLPDKLHIATFAADPEAKTFSVTYADGEGKPLDDLSGTADLVNAGDKFRFGWIKSTSALKTLEALSSPSASRK